MKLMHCTSARIYEAYGRARRKRERERPRKIRSLKVSLGRLDRTESIIDVRVGYLRYDLSYTRAMRLGRKIIIKLLLMMFLINFLLREYLFTEDLKIFKNFFKDKKMMDKAIVLR